MYLNSVTPLGPESRRKAPPGLPFVSPLVQETNGMALPPPANSFAGRVSIKQTVYTADHRLGAQSDRDHLRGTWGAGIAAPAPWGCEGEPWPQWGRVSPQVWGAVRVVQHSVRDVAHHGIRAPLRNVNTRRGQSNILRHILAPNLAIATART